MHITQEPLGFAGNNAPLSRPLFSVKVAAGMPLPADNHTDQWLDLNHYLIHNPTQTFFVRVQGESMVDAGIFDGDLLIIDRAIQPRDGSVVLAKLNGEFTVKRLRKNGKQLILMPENQAYPPIEITDAIDFEIWGVATNAIHSL